MSLVQVLVLVLVPVVGYVGALCPRFHVVIRRMSVMLLVGGTVLRQYVALVGRKNYFPST